MNIQPRITLCLRDLDEEKKDFLAQIVRERLTDKSVPQQKIEALLVWWGLEPMPRNQSLCGYFSEEIGVSLEEIFKIEQFTDLTTNDLIKCMGTTTEIHAMA